MARPRQVTDKQILEAARECFLEHGPSVSTTVIAERLGVSQAALFKRFSTKEQLMVRALEPADREPMMERLQTGPVDGDIRDQLLEIAIVASRYFENLIPCIAVLRAAGVMPERVFRQGDRVPPPVEGQRLMAGWFRRAQQKGWIRGVDADALAIAFVGALQTRPFMEHLTGRQILGVDAETYAHQVVDVIWRGISPRGES